MTFVDLLDLVALVYNVARAVLLECTHVLVGSAVSWVQTIANWWGGRVGGLGKGGGYIWGEQKWMAPTRLTQLRMQCDHPSR